ncbi:putative elongator complex protein 4 [Teleopsis dalmanni]|uniref:putative elongator complex protein 4 n=1 Tax=Teleopsis dalmanni TaxID=139649 RepID=UPI0018CF184D|nr:putative elongator complex protein 4 [Teleopsis dalmanni]
MSNFRKRHFQKQVTPGTRTSPQTGQVITSSGNPSLDVILGGGLPIGSICLIEEDKYVTHSKVLAKYFLAEGVASFHCLFLGSLDDDPVELLSKLPKPLNEEEIEKELADDKQNGETDKNGLRIAWRYNDLPIVNSEQATAKIGHHFNLMEQFNPLVLRYADTTIWNGTKRKALNDEDDEDGEEDWNENGAGDNCNVRKDDPLAVVNDTPQPNIGDNSSSSTEKKEEQKLNDSNTTPTNDATLPSPSPPPPLPTTTTEDEAQKSKIFSNEKYLRIYNDIQELLSETRFKSNFIHKNLCRVCITSLGSPMWYDENFGKDILKFLTALRAAVRNVVSVCFITMPMHLIAKYDENLVSKIRNLVDYSIELESFAGSERETNPAFQEYHGLIHLRKISAINALSAYMPETTDLAFKLRRKKFVIEKFHLPPELDDNNQDSPMDVTRTISCGSNTSTNLETSLDF